MHLPKLLGMICVAAVAGATVSPAQTDDSAAQARAREALHQKINEISGTTSTPAVAAPAPAPSAPVAPPAEVPASAVPPMRHLRPAATMDNNTPAVSSAPVNHLTPDQEAALRAQLRQAISTANDSDFGSATAPTPIDPNAEEKVFAAERQAKAMRDSEAPLSKPARLTGATGPIPAYVPPIDITPPSAMVPGSKEQRLYELLQKYKADQITPTEYHEQRAKILGEP